jgi:ribosomal protein L6P/L9E
LAHHIGAFFGEIVKAVKTDVTAPQGVKVEVSRETSEEKVQGPSGELVLRRTTIEEVVVLKESLETASTTRAATDSGT